MRLRDDAVGTEVHLDRQEADGSWSTAKGTVKTVGVKIAILALDDGTEAMVNEPRHGLQGPPGHLLVRDT